MCALTESPPFPLMHKSSTKHDRLKDEVSVNTAASAKAIYLPLFTNRTASLPSYAAQRLPNSPIVGSEDKSEISTWSGSEDFGYAPCLHGWTCAEKVDSGVVDQLT